MDASRLQICCVSEDCCCLLQRALAFLDSHHTCVSPATAGALPRPSHLHSCSPAPRPGPTCASGAPGTCAVPAHVSAQPASVCCFQVSPHMFPLPGPSHLRPQTLPARKPSASSWTSHTLQGGVSGCSVLQDGRPSHTPPPGQLLGSGLQIPPSWSSGRQVQGSDFAPLHDSHTAGTSLLISSCPWLSPGGSDSGFPMSGVEGGCWAHPQQKDTKSWLSPSGSQHLFRVKSLRLFPAFVFQCLLIVNISSSFHL